MSSPDAYAYILLVRQPHGLGALVKPVNSRVLPQLEVDAAHLAAVSRVLLLRLLLAETAHVNVVLLNVFLRLMLHLTR